MGVICKGGIRGGGGGGGGERPGRACQHCDITTICRKTGVPENQLSDDPGT